jgi:hypothetical protein
LGIAVVALALLAVAGSAAAQCPPGGGCTEYLGAGSKGSYFRILVPDDWDGDLFLVNHGFDLDPLNIAPHHTCKGDPTKACTTNADCAGFGPQACNNISTMGFEAFLLPKHKAVGASTYSETGWSVFQSRFDLKDMIKFMSRRGPGKPTRVIVTGFSMGGAVTVDATMRLKAGQMIQGAVPLCPCAGGGNPSWDAATDIRLVYDWLCDDVPGGSFSSLPDVGDATISQTELALTVNACLGVLSGSPTPEQVARRDTLIRMTKFSGNNTELIVTMGFAVLGMGDFVNDPERLRGRRHGWNEGLDYSVFQDSAAQAFNDEVPRFGPGPGRAKLRQNTFIDFTKGNAKRVNYPILAFGGKQDFVCLPEFQKLYADAAALGGKDHAQIWGSTRGHCQFTANEIRSVVEEYLDWLDAYGSLNVHKPTTADVLARCLALPGSSPSQCNFDTAFKAPPLSARVPPRADWPEAGKNPLP